MPQRAVYRSGNLRPLGHLWVDLLHEVERQERPGDLRLSKAESQITEFFEANIR